MAEKISPFSTLSAFAVSADTTRMTFASSATAPDHSTSRLFSARAPL